MKQEQYISHLYMRKDSVSAIYVNQVAELDFILKPDFLLCYTFEQKWTNGSSLKFLF